MKIIKPLIVIVLHSPVTSILSGPNIFFRTLRPYSPPKETHQVAQLQEARIHICCVLIFMFVDSKKLKISYVHATNAYKGSRGIPPPILNLCTRWR
jgi:hypothetical protein